MTVCEGIMLCICIEYFWSKNVMNVLLGWGDGDTRGAC